MAINNVNMVININSSIIVIVSVIDSSRIALGGPKGSGEASGVSLELRYSYPYPCPKKVTQTACCTMMLIRFVIRTVLGMGLGVSVTAHDSFLFRAAANLLAQATGGDDIANENRNLRPQLEPQMTGLEKK